MATQETDNKPLIISIIVVVVLACGSWLAWHLWGDQLKARDQLNQVIRAYKNAQFTSAIEHFKKAISLRPKLTNARLYLPTAYASLYFQMKRLADAKVWYKKQMDLTPNDPIPYYSVGVIDWGQAYPARMKARSDAHMEPQGPQPFKDKKAQDALCSVNLPILEDGFK